MAQTLEASNHLDVFMDNGHSVSAITGNRLIVEFSVTLPLQNWVLYPLATTMRSVKLGRLARCFSAVKTFLTPIPAVNRQFPPASCSYHNPAQTSRRHDPNDPDVLSKKSPYHHSTVHGLHPRTVALNLNPTLNPTLPMQWAIDPEQERTAYPSKLGAECPARLATIDS